jgi:polyphosphate kinase 2 (PPK2 family)
MHISKKEQKQRFKKLEDDPLNAWHVTKEDWRNHKRYKKWTMLYDEMLEKTETEWGPWTIVPATSKRVTNLKVYETIISALEKRLGLDALAMPPAVPGKEPVLALVADDGKPGG